MRFWYLFVWMLCTCATAGAQDHYYEGTITFRSLTGKDCGGVKAGDRRTLQLVAGVTENRIGGYYYVQDADPAHFSGDKADKLAVTGVDPQDTDGSLLLQGIGGMVLSGELHGKVLKPDEAGCNLSLGEISANRAGTEAQAEEQRARLAAAFDYVRNEYAARARDPQRYAEMQRIAGELVAAEAEGSGQPQEALRLREQLQPLFEQLYGTESSQSFDNLAAHARLLGNARHYAEALVLRKQALALAEKVFPQQVAVAAYNLGDVLESLGRNEEAASAFGRAAQADEQQYGPDHPEVAADLQRQAKTLQALQRKQQAVALYRRILAIREKTPDEKPEAIAQARSNLAQASDAVAYGQLTALEDRLGQARNDNNLTLSVELRRQMLPLAERCFGKPSRYLADLLFRQAYDLESVNRDQEALALYPQVLEMIAASYGKEHEKVATTLDNFAHQHKKMGHGEAVLPLYRRALAIREQAANPSPADIASSLKNLALAHQSLAQYEQALPLLQRALTLRENALGAEHVDTSYSLNMLASLYDIMGKYALAEPLFLRALAIQEKTLGAEHPDTIGTLNNLAVLYYGMGRYGQALPLYQRVLAGNEKLSGPDHPDTADVLNNLSVLYNSTGQYEMALPLKLRALAIREKALGPEHPATAQSLDSLAFLYGNLGQSAQAMPLFQRALAIREKVPGPDHPDTAASLNNLSILYEDLGQYDKALPLRLRALAIREKSLGSEHPLTAVSLNNLAALYETLGEYGKAAPLYRRAVAIHEKVLGDHEETANSLSNLALLYQMQGQYEQALPLMSRVLAIREKVMGTEHASYAGSLNNLAYLYLSGNERDKALPLLQRALAVFEKTLGLEHARTINSLNSLAVYHEHAGQAELALPLYLRAYGAAQSSRAPDLLRLVQANLGNYYLNQSNSSAAIFHLKGAVNTMQAIRTASRGLDKDLQKSLLKKNEEIYKKLANLLVAGGRLAEAQQVLSMLKEDEYFDFIRRDAEADTRGTRMAYSGAEKPYAGHLETLGDEGAKLADQYGALNKRAALGLTPEEAQQRDRLKAKLAEQEQRTLAMLNDLAQRLPAEHLRLAGEERAAQEKLVAVTQRQLAGMGEGTVLIHYLMLGDKIRILVTSQNGQVAREAPVGEAALYPQLVALRKALEDPRVDPRPLSRTLYQSLVAPITGDIKDAKTLMLSLDGALRYIPYAALYDGEKYLVENYRLAMFTAAAQGKLTESAKPSWEVTALGVTKAHPGFSALPGVKAELAGIVGSQGIPGESHLDRAFTAERMQQSLKRNRPVLHLASHFQFTPGTEADSYLLLGDGKHLSLKALRQGDYRFDGLDLLTLSACATAMHGGREANGKEVEGFGALAQLKGAKGVLATLWPIADASTAQLMQTLYRVREQQRLNKAEALRQAQLALLHGRTDTTAGSEERGARRVNKDGKPASAQSFVANPQAPFAHPYYWAPFILMGNWL